MIKKLDIFRTLGHVNKKNVEFYDSLTEDEQKGFQPLVVMRWMTGTADARQIVFVNELVNPLVFPFHKHPKLLSYLMMISSSGVNRRYKWIARGKKAKSKPLSIKVIQQYYKYSESDAASVLPLLSKEDIVAMAEEQGMQKEQMAKLKVEFRKSNQ